MPLVIRLLYYVRRKPKRVVLTKKNVLLRDDYTCGYCLKKGVRMTVDHVIPQAAGGRSTWENLVAACEPCNGRKRDRTPAQAGMPAAPEAARATVRAVRHHQARDAASALVGVCLALRRELRGAPGDLKE